MICYCKKISSKLLTIPKQYLLYILSFTPLAAAMISEYIFDMHPCELCIYQRIPFAVILILSVIYTLLIWADKRSSFSGFTIGKIGCIIASLSILLLLANASVAFFHVGVEYKWWIFGECSADFDTSSIEALKRQIMGAPNVRCDDIQFSFLGLSMAGWNVLYSTIAALLILASGNHKCSNQKCKKETS